MSLGDSSTELGKVRGLGSAREGGEHWIAERVSSVALLLLGVWLIASAYSSTSRSRGVKTSDSRHLGISRARSTSSPRFLAMK